MRTTARLRARSVPRPGTGKLAASFAAALFLGTCAAGAAPPGPAAPPRAPSGHRGGAATGPGPSATFLRNASGLSFEAGDPLAVRVISEFGAVFVAQNGAFRPERWLFPDEDAVAIFQAGLPVRTAAAMPHAELQDAAFAALEAAVRDANAGGLTLSLRGAGSARRSYGETVRLWRSRLEPGLAHWVRAGVLSRAEADRVLALPAREQVRAALDLEARGAWLSTRFDKSILQSVAAPGTSQHLSMLAIDVAEHANPAVRAILARHGWHQTVYSDLPHFTYVGVPEKSLPALGLVRRENAGRTFWVVDVPLVRGAPEPDVMEECPF